MPSEAALLALAESVADGREIDWDLAESEATPEDRQVLRQLRVVANISTLHRTLPQQTTLATRGPVMTTPALGTWGDLKILERIGGGAFADVYRAWDTRLEREVALKLLRVERDDADALTSRITTEGRLLARVRHPNVVTVYGVAKHQSCVGLWMELVHGRTLEQQLREGGPMGGKEAALAGIELCRALAALHGAGLVHRDVKAQNVVREDGGRIVLMDLGTGRDLESTAATGAEANLAGTPLYLAPEVLTGTPASARSDLYSLGVLLYRLVTASFPVRATTIEELHTKHTDGRAVPLLDARPDLPEAFVAVIERAISPDPARRYASAGALETALRGALEEGAARDVRQPATTSGWHAAAVAAAVLITLVAGAWFVSSRTGGSPTPVAPGAVHSIAVLPLANVSGSSSQDYLADGITDELIDTLGQLHDLNVISRTSTVQFKGSKKPLPEIARAVNADAVLEGTVFVQPATGGDAAGRVVRVNARLIYAGTDTLIWSQTFETVFGDVLSLQSRIGRAVADGISLRLSAQQQRLLDPAVRGGGSGQDADALDLYLHGRYYWNMRTPEGLKRSVQYFHEAVARDARFARAYAGLADAYSLMLVYDIMPRAQAEDAALAAATKAIGLDESLAEAHTSVAYVRMLRFEWSAAENEFRRAIALRPSYALAHRWYATCLLRLGRSSEAIGEMKTALEQDPLSVGANASYAQMLMMTRRYDDAAAYARKALQIDPGYGRARILLAEIHALQHQYANALAEAERAASQQPQDVEILGDLGYIRAVAGRRADASKTREQLVRRASANEDAAAGGVAIIYVGLGDADRAFEWLAKARDLRDPWIEYLKLDPRFDPVRADSRFAHLLTSVGLPQ